MKPIFHYAPGANWINDPNGLCQVDGVYHMYYQYNPNDSVWGDMHWGHAMSTDLMHWETQEPAMAPALDKREIHCFSGGCCKDEQGRPHFFYTSVGREEDGRDARYGAQQWYAEPVNGDMNCLQQTDDHALLQDIHPGLTVLEWRDPCVLRWQGQYLMVLGGLCEERGCVLLYTSPDMRNWTYHHMLVQSEKADGRAYECPNFFQVDGKFVLLYSPYDPVEVMVGDLDEQLQFHVQTKEVLDPAGRQGFYAPQVFQDEQGRVILQGWMPECDGDERARQRGYSGAMNLPRILSIRDGYLHAEPLHEVWTMADTSAAPGRHFVAEATFARENLPLTVTMLASEDKKEHTMLTITAEGMMTLDRSQSSRDDAPDQSPIARSIRLAENNELFLTVDGSALECCVDGQWLSGRVYPVDESCSGVQLQAAGQVELRIGVIR